MGNGPGNLKEYWEAIYRYDRLLGGCQSGNGSIMACAGIAESGEEWFAYGGECGDEPNDGNFCIDGLNFPDRIPHSGLIEYKQILTPAHVDPVDLRAGAVKIVSRLDFATLAHLHGAWSLWRDGDLLQQGALPPLDVPAAGEKLVTIPYTLPVGQPGAEYWLNINFTLAEDMPWAPRGFAVAHAQFAVPVAARQSRCSLRPLFLCSISKRQQTRICSPRRISGFVSTGGRGPSARGNITAPHYCPPGRG